MGFLTRLVTECYAPDGTVPDGEFVVLEPLVYQHCALRLTVEVGFVTDFASIPKAVQGVPGFDVNGRSRAAAVLHDRLYSGNGEITSQSNSPCIVFTHRFTRAVCDAIFREALLSLGVSPWVARAMWLGVRAGGWMYWRKRKDGLQADYDFAETPA